MLEELRGAIYLAEAVTIRERDSREALDAATKKHAEIVAEKEAHIRRVYELAYRRLEDASVAKPIESVNSCNKYACSSKMSPEQRIYHEGH